MSKLTDLKARLAKALDEARKIEASPAGDAGALSADQETRSAEIMTEVEQLETRIARVAKLDEAERREVGKPITGSGEREWSDLVNRFEMRQVALFLDEGKALQGPTADVVQELRARGGYRGCPVPWLALEQRVGETVASGVPDPKQTRPIIDRLFPASVAGRMGAQMINIDHGAVEYPVVTSSVTAGWADGETANVAGPTAFVTTDRPLAPDHNLGIQMKLTRKSMKQAGDALEQAVRRDMNSAIAAALDKAVFLGTGANGQPDGVLVGSYGITSTAVNDPTTWAAFRAAVTRFMTANAAVGPGNVNLMIRPEVYDYMDGALIDGTAVSEWDRLLKNIPLQNIAMTSNALAAPAGSPLASKALLTTTAGGVAPIFVGLWGAVDLIRDPYSDAASGGLRLTALVTADVTIARPAQLEILTGIETDLDVS